MAASSTSSPAPPSRRAPWSRRSRADSNSSPPIAGKSSTHREPEMTYRDIMKDGLWNQNVVLAQLLGMCPTMAVTTSGTNGLGMGIATTVVLVASNAIVATIRDFVSHQVRIPVFIGLIATMVTLVDMSLNAWFHDLYKVLGLYIALIVANCAGLGARRLVDGPRLHRRPDRHRPGARAGRRRHAVLPGQPLARAEIRLHGNHRAAPLRRRADDDPAAGRLPRPRPAAGGEERLRAAPDAGRQHARAGRRRGRLPLRNERSCKSASPTPNPRNRSG